MGNRHPKSQAGVWWADSTGRFAVVEGKVISTQAEQPKSRSSVSRPSSTTRRWWKYLNDSWLFTHYKAGFVGALLLIDALALVTCLVDYDAFKNIGLKPVAAFRVAWETVGESASLKTAASVFFFFLLTPFASGVLSHFAQRPRQHRGKGSGAKNRVKEKNTGGKTLKGWRRLFLTAGWKIVAAHLLLACVISAFTLMAGAMENLAGYRDKAPNYSFNSSWMWVVSGINWLYSGIVLPVILKFAARSVGREGPHFSDVFKEGVTEFSAEH